MSATEKWIKTIIWKMCVCECVHEHALHMCKNMHTLTQAVYKVHRGIKTLINLFLLPGVYSNALEVVMEDIWR